MFPRSSRAEFRIAPICIFTRPWVYCLCFVAQLGLKLGSPICTVTGSLGGSFP